MTLLRLSAAFLGGLLLYVSFPPVGFFFLAPLGVALFALSCFAAPLRLGAVAGGVFGCSFFVPLLEWSSAVAGLGAHLALSFLQASFFVALGVFWAFASRSTWWVVSFAGSWVLFEALRSRFPFGGFPWGRLGFSQADSPLLGLAGVGGAPLVGFFVALLGALAASALLSLFRLLPGRPASLPAGGRGSSWGAPGVSAASGVSLVVLGVLLAALAPVPAPSASVTVAAVQGNVPREGLGVGAQRAAVLRNHVEATRRLAADVAAGRVSRPDLVVWPENASDLDPFTDVEAFGLIDGVVSELGVPVLVGAVLLAPGGEGLLNAGVVWDPVSGPGEVYVKQHPVPFGEYVPFRPLLRRVTDRVDLVPRDFLPGDAPGVLEVGGVVLGDVICFEVAYDGLVRGAVLGGGEVLVVQTNNATFGYSGESVQQLAMGRLRAVEHGRAVVVAATSGVSAVVAPDGAVVSRTGLFVDGVLVEDVPVVSGFTWASRLGVFPEVLVSALALLGLLAGGVRSRVRVASPGLSL